MQLQSKKYEVVCITEAWFTNSTPSSIFENMGYNVYRLDRENRVGGGVCAFVTINLRTTAVTLDVSSEIVVFKISNISFAVVYRTPSMNLGEFRVFLQDLDKVCLSSDKLILVGDFNVRNIDWIRKVAVTPQAVSLLEASFAHNLNQIISVPTHRLDGILDLVFSRNVNILDSVVSESTIPSDHFCITFSFDVHQVQLLSDKLLIRDFVHADFDAINRYLAGVAFRDLFAGRNVDEMSSVLENSIATAVDLFVPLVTAKNFKLTHKWTKETVDLHSLYELSLKKYHRRKSESNRNRKNRLRCEFRRRARRDERLFEERILNSDKGRFFKLFKKCTKSCIEVAELQLNGVRATSDLEKAEMLNWY